MRCGQLGENSVRMEHWEGGGKHPSFPCPMASPTFLSPYPSMTRLGRRSTSPPNWHFVHNQGGYEGGHSSTSCTHSFNMIDLNDGCNFIIYRDLDQPTLFELISYYKHLQVQDAQDRWKSIYSHESLFRSNVQPRDHRREIAELPFLTRRASWGNTGVLPAVSRFQERCLLLPCSMSSAPITPSTFP